MSRVRRPLRIMAMRAARPTIRIVMRRTAFDLNGRMVDPKHFVDEVVRPVKHLVAVGFLGHFQVHRQCGFRRAQRPDVKVMRAGDTR